MTAEEKQIDLKKRLLEECISLQMKTIEASREAMLRVQESANEETAGGEDKFESFREQCQIDREMYAKKIKESMAGLSILKVLDYKHIHEVKLGSVVITDSQSFFIGISLGEIKLDGQSYFAISTQSPLFLAMSGKKVGDSFDFRGKKNLIKEVF